MDPSGGKLVMVGLVLGYSFSSSMLTIINKYAVWVFPYPGMLTALQYIVCFVSVAVLGRLGVLEHSPLQMDLLLKFLPASLVFYVSIYTNTELLKHANIETFIVFRSSTPLLVALAETMFLKRKLPSCYTFLSLFVIVGGAVGYVLTDYGFSIKAYSWAIAYLVTITFDMVYIKSVVMSVNLNTWGMVLYNNMEALLLAPPVIWIMGETNEVLQGGMRIESAIAVPVFISCAFGLSISYFGFACRKAVSATAFTVIGVTNKILTILINVLMWDKHASPAGIFFLLITIAGGILYQRSVSKPSITSKELKGEPSKEERTSLLEKGTALQDIDDTKSFPDSHKK